MEFLGKERRDRNGQAGAQDVGKGERLSFHGRSHSKSHASAQ